MILGVVFATAFIPHFARAGKLMDTATTRVAWRHSLLLRGLKRTAIRPASPCWPKPHDWI